MFIPFLAAAAVATVFAQLGAMSVQIAVLTLSLKALSVALLAAVILVIALSRRRRCGSGLAFFLRLDFPNKCLGKSLISSVHFWRHLSRQSSLKRKMNLLCSYQLGTNA